MEGLRWCLVSVLGVDVLSESNHIYILVGIKFAQSHYGKVFIGNVSNLDREADFWMSTVLNVMVTIVLGRTAILELTVDHNA